MPDMRDFEPMSLSVEDRTRGERDSLNALFCSLDGALALSGFLFAGWEKTNRSPACTLGCCGTAATFFYEAKG